MQLPNPKKQKTTEEELPKTPRLSPVESSDMPPPLLKKEIYRKDVDLDALKKMSYILQEHLINDI